MICNEIKCRVNTSFGLVGGCIPCTSSVSALECNFIKNCIFLEHPVFRVFLGLLLPRPSPGKKGEWKRLNQAFFRKIFKIIRKILHPVFKEFFPSMDVSLLVHHFKPALQWRTEISRLVTFLWEMTFLWESHGKQPMGWYSTHLYFPWELEDVLNEQSDSEIERECQNVTEFSCLDYTSEF